MHSTFEIGMVERTLRTFDSFFCAKIAQNMC
jgi:hypothetical protein